MLFAAPRAQNSMLSDTLPMKTADEKKNAIRKETETCASAYAEIFFSPKLPLRTRASPTSTADRIALF